jgi:hypothetical protein
MENSGYTGGHIYLLIWEVKEIQKGNSLVGSAEYKIILNFYNYKRNTTEQRDLSMMHNRDL